MAETVMVLMALVTGAGSSGLFCYRLGFREGRMSPLPVTPVVRRGNLGPIAEIGPSTNKEMKPATKPAWSGWRSRAEGKSMSPEQKREQRVANFVRESSAS